MQLFKILARPKLLVDILGKNVPAVSLYFCSLVIVKLFAAGVYFAYAYAMTLVK